MLTPRPASSSAPIDLNRMPQLVGALVLAYLLVSAWHTTVAWAAPEPPSSVEWASLAEAFNTSQIVVTGYPHALDSYWDGPMMTHYVLTQIEALVGDLGGTDTLAYSMIGGRIGDIVSGAPWITEVRENTEYMLFFARCSDPTRFIPRHIDKIVAMDQDSVWYGPQRRPFHRTAFDDSLIAWRAMRDLDQLVDEADAIVRGTITSPIANTALDAHFDRHGEFDVAIDSVLFSVPNASILGGSELNVTVRATTGPDRVGRGGVPRLPSGGPVILLLDKLGDDWALMTSICACWRAEGSQWMSVTDGAGCCPDCVIPVAAVTDSAMQVAVGR